MAYWVIQTGSNAAVAVGFATYFSVFFPELSTARIVAHVGPFAISAGQLAAVALILVLSATHYVGIKKGARIQGVFTLLIVLAPRVARRGRADRQAPAAAAPRRPRRRSLPEDSASP